MLNSNEEGSVNLFKLIFHGQYHFKFKLKEPALSCFTIAGRLRNIHTKEPFHPPRMEHREQGRPSWTGQLEGSQLMESTLLASSLET